MDTLKMYIDINAADVLLNEYPEIKNNPRFNNLVYSYPIKKILCGVVIIDAERRDRNERYAANRHFTIDTQRSSMILDDIRNNSQQHITRLDIPTEIIFLRQISLLRTTNE